MHRQEPRQSHRHVKSAVLRWILISCGWCSVAAGVLGIFLPLVPTVPFLLLAATCFIRSSERFHRWLVDHNHLGPLIRDYLETGRITLRAKMVAIGMIWVSFPASVFLFVQAGWLKLLMLSIAAAVTFYLLRLPTVPVESDTSEANNG